VPELEHVAEQDDTIDALERREQGRPELGPTQQIGALLRTEVEV
jgi:hypothetical protein